MIVDPFSHSRDLYLERILVPLSILGRTCSYHQVASQSGNNHSCVHSFGSLSSLDFEGLLHYATSTDLVRTTCIIFARFSSHISCEQHPVGRTAAKYMVLL